VWEFKQIKDLYLRIVAPCNLFIEFIHDVRSVAQLLIERTQKRLLKIEKMLDWLEESR